MQFLINCRGIILLFLFCIFSIAVFLGKDLRNCFHLLMVALNITDRSEFQDILSSALIITSEKEAVNK